VSAVKALKRHGLLDVLGDPVALPEEKFRWWQDKEGVKAEGEGDLERLSEHFAPLIDHFRRHPADWIAVHPWKAEMDRFGGLCKRFGYSFRKVVELLVRAVGRLDNEPSPVARVVRELPKLVRRAEERTQTNRRPHCAAWSCRAGRWLRPNDLVQAERARKAG
jgi:hypothetical protein